MYTLHVELREGQGERGQMSVASQEKIGVYMCHQGSCFPLLFQEVQESVTDSSFKSFSDLSSVQKNINLSPFTATNPQHQEYNQIQTHIGHPTDRKQQQTTSRQKIEHASYQKAMFRAAKMPVFVHGSICFEHKGEEKDYQNLGRWIINMVRNRCVRM